MLAEVSLRCVRRDRFSRNLFEYVSAESRTVTKAVTSYNVCYGVLPRFGTFFRFRFHMRLNPEKRRAGPPKSEKNPGIVVVDASLAGRFLLSESLAGTEPGLRAPSVRGTIVEGDLKDVQPYPVELWPETRAVVGRSSSGEPLYPYQVAVVLGRGNSPLSRRGGPLGG